MHQNQEQQKEWMQKEDILKMGINRRGWLLPNFIDKVMYSDSEEISTMYPPFSSQYDFAFANVILLSSASKYHLRFDNFFQGNGHWLFTAIINS